WTHSTHADASIDPKARPNERLWSLSAGDDLRHRSADGCCDVRLHFNRLRADHGAARPAAGKTTSASGSSCKACAATIGCHASFGASSRRSAAAASWTIRGLGRLHGDARWEKSLLCARQAFGLTDDT